MKDVLIQVIPGLMVLCFLLLPVSVVRYRTETDRSAQGVPIPPARGAGDAQCLPHSAKGCGHCSMLRHPSQGHTRRAIAARLIGPRRSPENGARRAETAGTADSFWHTDFLAMWRKSGVRRLAKVVPMSAELAALVKADNVGEAGEAQILHAPDPEAARLLAEAERAHTAAEASQDVPAPKHTRPKSFKKSSQHRNQPRRQSRAARRGRRAGK
ncbi:hypothetical protein [Streptomyces sp. NPDC056165]|uniref:hypothetical protein n=1 Tax=Streptomyces sp. NPDC056165 TaxID=3345733 RepID=UPI0035D9CDA7